MWNFMILLTVALNLIRSDYLQLSLKSKIRWNFTLSLQSSTKSKIPRIQAKPNTTSQRPNLDTTQKSMILSNTKDIIKTNTYTTTNKLKKWRWEKIFGLEMKGLRWFDEINYRDGKGEERERKWESGEHTMSSITKNTSFPNYPVQDSTPLITNVVFKEQNIR